MLPVAKALADERIDRLLIILGPGSGKSLAMSVIYPTWALGIDPTYTIAGVSASEGLVKGFQRAAMEIVEHSPAYRSVFPKVRPDKDGGWSNERGMFVTGRRPGNPDPSYAAYGFSSKELVGKHAKILLLDDLHDRENSATSGQREKVRDGYFNTLMGRADPSGARIIVAGRRWAIDDLYGELIKLGEFVVLQLPAEREGSTLLYWDVLVPEGLECVFTEEAEAA